MRISSVAAGLMGLVSMATAAAVPMAKRASGERLVFAHYMLVTPPVNLDYASEMRLAKECGVDAFAVNYGGYGNDFDTFDQRLELMYQAAHETDFKLFLSMDMTSVTTGQRIVDVVTKYAHDTASLWYNNQLFLSTFQDGGVTDVNFDWQYDVITPIESQLNGGYVVFVPGITSTDYQAAFAPSYVDGVFSWPHQSTPLSEDKQTDIAFQNTATYTDKLWMAGIAPWFFRHYEGQNWGNLQDNDIFITRFKNLLTMDVNLIELVTWNDFGESSYWGKSDPQNRYVDWAYLSHKGYREMMQYFMTAFKEGKSDVMQASNIQDSVYMFYRTQPYDSQGYNDDIGPPTDADEQDAIFVVSFLSGDAQVTLSNGGKDTTFTAPAGLNMKAIPFQLGGVSLKATLNGNTIADKTGPEIVGQLSVTNENTVCI